MSFPCLPNHANYARPAPVGKEWTRFAREKLLVKNWFSDKSMHGAGQFLMIAFRSIKSKRLLREVCRFSIITHKLSTDTCLLCEKINWEFLPIKCFTCMENIQMSSCIKNETKQTRTPIYLCKWLYSLQVSYLGTENASWNMDGQFVIFIVEDYRFQIMEYPNRTIS